MRTIRLSMPFSLPIDGHHSGRAAEDGKRARGIRKVASEPATGRCRDRWASAGGWKCCPASRVKLLLPYPTGIAEGGANEERRRAAHPYPRFLGKGGRVVSAGSGEGRGRREAGWSAGQGGRGNDR